MGWERTSEKNVHVLTWSFSPLILVHLIDKALVLWDKIDEDVLHELGTKPNVQGWSNAGPGLLSCRCCGCQLCSVSDIDTLLILFLTLVGRAGRLSHFSRAKNHDVVFLSDVDVVVVVAGAAAGFSVCFPFTALEVGDAPVLIISATALSVSTTTFWTIETDPFCCGSLINSNAARKLERMTRVARKVRSTLGFVRWLMTVKGPGSENSDGSESTSERPWTLSIAGSWTSIMVVKRRGWRDCGEPGGEGLRGRNVVTKVMSPITIKSARLLPIHPSDLKWNGSLLRPSLHCSLKPKPYPSYPTDSGLGYVLTPLVVHSHVRY